VKKAKRMRTILKEVTIEKHSELMKIIKGFGILSMQAWPNRQPSYREVTELY
jgi:hypothetical protein